MLERKTKLPHLRLEPTTPYPKGVVVPAELMRITITINECKSTYIQWTSWAVAAVGVVIYLHTCKSFTSQCITLKLMIIYPGLQIQLAKRCRCPTTTWNIWMNRPIIVVVGTIPAVEIRTPKSYASQWQAMPRMNFLNWFFSAWCGLKYKYQSLSPRNCGAKFAAHLFLHICRSAAVTSNAFRL